MKKKTEKTTRPPKPMMSHAMALIALHPEPREQTRKVDSEIDNADSEVKPRKRVGGARKTTTPKNKRRPKNESETEAQVPPQVIVSNHHFHLPNGILGSLDSMKDFISGIVSGIVDEVAEAVRLKGHDSTNAQGNVIEVPRIEEPSSEKNDSVPHYAKAIEHAEQGYEKSCFDAGLPFSAGYGEGAFTRHDHKVDFEHYYPDKQVKSWGIKSESPIVFMPGGSKFFEDWHFKKLGLAMASIGYEVFIPRLDYSVDNGLVKHTTTLDEMVKFVDKPLCLVGYSTNALVALRVAYANKLVRAFAWVMGYASADPYNQTRARSNCMARVINGGDESSRVDLHKAEKLFVARRFWSQNQTVRVVTVGATQEFMEATEADEQIDRVARAITDLADEAFPKDSK